MTAAAKPAATTATGDDAPVKDDATTAPATTDTTAKPAAKPATTTKPKGYKVKGAAVVLRADDGSERYLYRGAPVDDSAFSKDSIKHALSVGLIEKAK